jgi:hypothetical protein
MKAKIIIATAIIGVTALTSVVYAGKEGKENADRYAGSGAKDHSRQTGRRYHH